MQTLESRRLLAGDFEGVLLERFDGIWGNSLASLTGHQKYPNSPDAVDRTTSFEAPFNVGNQYGVRMRGYVTAPTDGDYTFWLAADNHGSLLLSDSDQPSGATEIASVTGWTNRLQWDKYASQKSESITMVAGERYYIEALMKEVSGGDHLVVAWTGPGFSSPTVIDGQHLSVFQEPNHAPQAVNDAISIPEDSLEVVLDLLSNDTDSRGTELAISAFTQSPNGTVTQHVDGSLSYTPDANYFGTDSFSYTVINELGITDTATASVNVQRTQGLLMETFNGIGGGDLANLTNHASYPSSPATTQYIESFATARNSGNNYGNRIRGYLTAPATGEFTFWIAADDQGSFRISPSERPGDAVEVASTSAWTWAYQWKKYDSQQSDPISLVAGQRYYVEALMKEGGGGDGLAVAWSGPGISDTWPVVIDAEYLTAYDTSLDVAPVVDVQTQVLSGTEVRVTWSIPPSLPDSGYKVLASTDGGVNYEQVTTTAPGATSAVLAGLVPETDYRFQVRGITDAESLSNSIPATSPPVATPESDDSDNWFQVNIVTGMIRGDAGYSGTGSFSASEEFVQAGSASAAIFDSVSGTATITDFNDNTMDFVFGQSSAYNVSSASSWEGDEALPADWTVEQYLNSIGADVDIDNAYIITLEDSFEWKNIDADYNDFFWVVSVVSNAPPEFVFPESLEGEAPVDSYKFALLADRDASLGAVLAEDPDEDDVTYSSDDSYFSVDANTGEITVTDEAYIYSPDSGEKHSFAVTATDGYYETTTDVEIDLTATVDLQVEVNIEIELNDAQLQLIELQQQLAGIDSQRTENMWAYENADYGNFGTRLLALQENSMLPSQPGDPLIFLGIELNSQHDEISSQIDVLLAEGTDRERPNYIPEDVWQEFLTLFGNTGTQRFHQYPVGVQFDSTIHGFEVSTEGFSVIAGGETAEQQARNLSAALGKAAEVREGEEPSDDTWTKYVVDAALFTFVGDHAEADVNGLGVAASVLFGLSGFDIYKDVADLEYAVENWEWSWSHTGGTALTVVGLIPVIGVVKNFKSVAALSELKHVDDLADVPGDVKALVKSGDVKVTEASGGAVGDGSATLTKKSSTDSDVISIRCFARDTPVLTETGLRPIGTIKPGERVLAHNFESGQWEPQTVTERLDNVYEGNVLTIEAGGDRIEATVHHPFWVVEGEDLAERSIPRELSEGEDEGQSVTGRWVDSHELRVGDVLLNRAGERTPVTAISKRHEDQFEVTNLTIEDAHNYSVGSTSLLVHNNSICADTISETKGLISSGSKTVEEARDEFYTAARADGVLGDQIDNAWVEVLIGVDGDILRGLDDVPWGRLCESGCEDIADKILDAIGGMKFRIEPSRGDWLGPRNGIDTVWDFHDAVVKNGRVYDAITGPDGLSISDYKETWEFASDINFGF